MKCSKQKTPFSLQAVLLMAAVGSLAPYAMAAQTVCAPDTETRVFLGGISGAQPLADPQSSTAFRASPTTGYYVHYSMFDKTMAGGLNSSQIKEIAQNFSNKPSMAEIGLFHPGFFQQEWPSIVLNAGFKPDMVAINLPSSGTEYLSDQKLGDFSRLAQEGFAANLKMVAPIITPNSREEMRHVFIDSYWNNGRQAALQGRGIVIDTPPEFYLRELRPPEIGQKYRDLIHDEIQWARANKIPSAIILSPRGDAGKFREDAIAEREDLRRSDSLPTFWIFENYTKNDPTPVGTDAEPESVAGTAQWFAANATNHCVPK